MKITVLGAVLVAVAIIAAALVIRHLYKEIQKTNSSKGQTPKP